MIFTQNKIINCLMKFNFNNAQTSVTSENNLKLKKSNRLYSLFCDNIKLIFKIYSDRKQIKGTK